MIDSSTLIIDDCQDKQICTAHMLIARSRVKLLLDRSTSCFGFFF
uniref:Uncharacterized protein n=1 Tax=Triticum urartu TaxID=4572 RepID=A0A8R7U6A6_TRIUA